MKQERTCRQIPIELSSVIGNLHLQSVEHVFRKTTGIRRRLDHDRGNSGNEDGLGGPTFTMTRQIMHNLSAAG